MRLMRVGPAGRERPVVLTKNGHHLDARSVTDDFDGAFFAAGGLRRLREAASAGRLPGTDVSGERVGAPVARPGAVVCIGMNYAAHARESGAEPPKQPVVFYKAPNTVVGPYDDILIPRGAHKVDWEVELGVVIGSRVDDLDSPTEALRHVAGYTVSHDVSERAFQLEISGGQWSKGKSCRNFNPLGPWLVPAEEVVDPQRLRLRSWVNGEPRQDSSTSDMIFDIAQLIYDLSRVMVLDPGDLINTGTPEGVALSGRFGYLREGDVVTLEVEGLGRQEQRVVPTVSGVPRKNIELAERRMRTRVAEAGAVDEVRSQDDSRSDPVSTHSEAAVSDERVSLASQDSTSWSELDAMVDAGAKAFNDMQSAGPDVHAEYLRRLADYVIDDMSRLTRIAHTETGLPLAPRLASELEAAADQLRSAAQASEDRSWTMPTISSDSRICSWYAPLPGPVVILGPSNFPFRFNPVGGGDFASAIASGHPVIAKGHPLHPATTSTLLDLARQAAIEVGLPPSVVQLTGDLDPADGLDLVADPRIAAVAFTGSRDAGLRLKQRADSAGVPFFGELSGMNPVVVMKSAAAARGSAIGRALGESIMLGMGQFCTRPGLLFLPALDGRNVVAGLASIVEAAPIHDMLSESTAARAEKAISMLQARGAVPLMKRHLAVTQTADPTLLEITIDHLTDLLTPEPIDAFGPICVIVWYADLGELRRALETLPGDLTGSIWAEDDDADYWKIEPVLRSKVGRLLNNKAPTGVAIVAGMNHGGPFPATSNPAFSAVGSPGSIRRFAMLQSYDNVPDSRLPMELQSANPLRIQRYLDDRWTDRSLG